MSNNSQPNIRDQLIPLHSRVVVRQIDEPSPDVKETTSVGGIILPINQSVKPNTQPFRVGQVLAKGPRVASEIRVGSRVLYVDGTGASISESPLIVIRVMDDTQILGVFPDATSPTADVVGGKL